MRVSPPWVVVALSWGLVACRHPNDGDAERTPSGANADHAFQTGPTADIDRRVTFQTRDGWTLVGTLHPGDTGPAVVLVHQLSSTRAEWAPLLERLHHGPHAWTTLTFDLRGHGESTLGPEGPTSWQSFGNDRAKWAEVARDVAAAVNSVMPDQRGGVFLVGSSIGSTAAVLFAADTPTVQGLVLLSPGTAYRGVDISDAMQHLLATERPALLLASEGDAYAAGTVRSFAPIHPTLGDADGAGSPISSRLYTGTDAHGVALGAPGAHPEIWDEIDRWLRAQRDVITVGHGR